MRQNLLYACLLLILSAATISCKKNAGTGNTNTSNKSHAAELLSYSIDGITAPVTIAAADHQVLVRFPDELSDGSNITASFTLSKGATATITGQPQVSGQTKNDYAGNVYFVITAEDGSTRQVYNIIGTNNNYSNNWGLGHIVQKAVSNNRTYDWYIGQANTGPYSNVNCAPSSTSMAIKWYDSTFSHTPQEARDSIPVGGELWHDGTVTNYLRSYNVNYSTFTLTDTVGIGTATIKKQLDKGCILIMFITTSGLRYSTVDTAHVDRYYDWSAGHCIIVKGYRDVDYQTFFEVYDPWNFEFYTDGSPKGKDRFYRAEDLVKSSSFNGGACWAIIPK